MTQILDGKALAGKTREELKHSSTASKSGITFYYNRYSRWKTQP